MQELNFERYEVKLLTEFNIKYKISFILTIF